MNALPPLVTDLALLLIVAGLVTIVFKRLRQPLVLGYIVAGFLAGPHMPYTPSVSDTSSIQTWSELGVVLLMFTLGLEFSFKRIARMGIRPIIAACAVMTCMAGVGMACGRLFGWTGIDSLFLGGMLAMSSTTIIYKAFDDLGLRTRRYTGEVLSVLILEDILGIVLMVLLSAIAVGRGLDGAGSLMALLRLGFFLVLWFVVGVYVVPILLRRAGRWMNGETLLVVSVGLCFGLVVLAAQAGYSAAFGAFMMGSILAETIEAERIAVLVRPLRDLFGAVFFVSVGMLVDIGVLITYLPAITLLCLAIIVGQATLGSASFLLAGHPLRRAVQCGFSLAQIGEFAFIIAALGVSLGVTSEFLYPVVVAVSVVTTFLTPYMIRASEPVGAYLERKLPARSKDAAPSAASKREPADGKSAKALWRDLIPSLLQGVGAYFTLALAVAVGCVASLRPALGDLLGRVGGNALCGVLCLLMLSPFLRAIVCRKNHSKAWVALAQQGRAMRALLVLTKLVRWGIAAGIIAYVLARLSALPLVVHLGSAIVILYIMVQSRRVKWVSIRMERTFLQNLRSREVHARHAERGTPGYAGRLESRGLHLARIAVPLHSPWAGQTLGELLLPQRYGAVVAAILRGGERINLPSASARLYPQDELEAIGDDAAIEALRAGCEGDGGDGGERALPRAEQVLLLRRLILSATSPLAGKRLSESALRKQYRCIAVGIERSDGTLQPATASTQLAAGSALWLVCEEGEWERLRSQGMPTPPRSGSSA